MKNHLTIHNVALRTICLIAILIVSLSGCSMYQNITSYFNTYYNAQKLFSDAETELKKTPQKDVDTNYFAQYKANSSLQDKFDKVIEKCSKLIQFYPQSRWIDDAIMMIGKSYVYLNESESAVRKFQELLENFPTSDLRSEAKLWYAKAEYYSKKDDAAIKLIKELVPEAQAEGKDDIALESLMLEGQIYLERNEYDQAAEAYARAVDVSGNGYMRAVAAFQLGKSYEHFGDKTKAEKAYSKVTDFEPDLGLVYRSRLNHGRMLTQLGQYKKAMETFGQMRDEQLKPDELALVEFEIGNTFDAMGDTAAAFATYTFVDTTYRHTDGSAKSYYQRALIFESKYFDFVRAREFYVKAKDEFAASEITPLAQQKSDFFTRYFNYYSDLAKYSNLLYKASHPDTSHSIADSSSAIIDTTNSKNITRTNIDTLHLHRDSTVAHILISPIDTIKSTTVVQINPDTLRQHADSALTAAKIPAVVDTIQKAFKPPEPSNEQLQHPSGPERLRERQLARGHLGNVKNDDLLKISADSTNDVSSQLQMEADSLETKSDSLKNKSNVASRKINPTLSPDTLRYLIAQSQFELAGLLYLGFALPDSAQFWYEKIVMQVPPSLFAPRALYALAEIHRVKHDSIIVDSLYQAILNHYAKSEYALQVKKLLGMAIEKPQPDLAESKYQEAEQQLQIGNTTLALQKFKTISIDYTVSPFASKASYTVGWIYENILYNNDSASVWYRYLVKNYPASTYAAVAGPKLAVKDKPESLQQFIKTNDIQLVGKQSQPQRGQRTTTAREKNAKEENEEQQLHNRRNTNRDEDEDTNTDEDQQTQQDEPDQPEKNNND